MPYINKPATLGPNMFLIKTKELLWHSHFAYYSLAAEFCQQQLKRMASNTTAQPKLNKDNLRSTITILPPISEQTAIADYLDSRCAAIDSIIAEKEALIADLEAYKKSLIYEVVTGKRKVA